MDIVYLAVYFADRYLLLIKWVECQWTKMAHFYRFMFHYATKKKRPINFSQPCSNSTTAQCSKVETWTCGLKKEVKDLHVLKNINPSRFSIFVKFFSISKVANRSPSFCWCLQISRLTMVIFISSNPTHGNLWESSWTFLRRGPVATASYNRPQTPF